MEVLQKYHFPTVIKILLPFDLLTSFCVVPLSNITMFFYRTELHLSEAKAMFVHHTIASTHIISSTIGAIIADSYIGKWRCLKYGKLLSLLAVPFTSISVISGKGLPQYTLFITGKVLASLFAIHMTCIGPFLGEQFRMPEQQQLYRRYLSLVYYLNNAVISVSYIVIPKLSAMKCLGQQTCYPLVFWLAQVSVFLHTCVFLSCSKMYVKVEPQRNMFLETVGCIKHALQVKARFPHKKLGHWIDYARDKYDEEIRRDVKQLLNLCAFLPISLFMWTLYLQCGSRWIYQASHMDNRITDSIVIHPSQVIVLNPVLVVILLPIMEMYVFPSLLQRGCLKTALQRMCTAFVFIGLSFVVAGFVQLAIEKSLPVKPPTGQSALKVLNPTSDFVNVLSEEFSVQVSPYSTVDVPGLQVKGTRNLTMTITVGRRFIYVDSVSLKEKQYSSFYITKNSLVFLNDGPASQSSDGKPSLRVIFHEYFRGSVVRIVKGNDFDEIRLDNSSDQILPIHETGLHDIFLDSMCLYKDVAMLNGGAYTLILDVNRTGVFSKIITTTQPSDVNVMWIIPQYMLVTLGEVLHTVAYNMFVYTQAPPSMRSVVSSFFHMTSSLANLIVSAVAIMELTKLSTESFIYGILMLVSTGLYILIAVWYNYKEVHD